MNQAALNKFIEENNNIIDKDLTPNNSNNIKKFDKIINELKNNIEANSVKFDRSNNNISLDLNLIGEATYNDFGKQYLELESNKRKFMVSPNSPFVMHIKGQKNKNS